VASEPYSWNCHQAAVEVLVRMAARDRRRCLDLFDHLAANPFASAEHCFDLADHAPFYLVNAGRWICTYQVDHAAKQVRILALE
jgi:hypothetical protein